ncbi:Protein CBG26285 [Caenorhabditis briggsae]|uniref:Protein CBG26285 n=1 Tax=Caenorhabditis briggsae TaxID=6238 RepID=B6ILY3_CAEBR|nr:Protein CBG26285 [Caenorhabditis briggsae]CAS00913.1 Protein CBG26285 [Caenorhabditis briggsae]
MRPNLLWVDKISDETGENG